MAWPGNRVQQMVIAKLSLRLSLSNPSNIWHCSKENWNLPQKTTEWERERNREREKERKQKKNERKRERASSMPNDVGNRPPQVEFSHRFCLWMCITVFAWFMPSLMDCRVWSQVVAFGGPYRFTVFCAYFWQKTPAILKWSSTILTVTHMAHAYKSAYLTSLWNRPNQRHVRPGVMRCYERCFNSEAGPCTEAQASTIWMKRHVIAKPVRGSIMISSIRTSDSEQVNNKD